MIVAPAGSVNERDKKRGDAQAEGDLGIARVAASRMQAEGDLHLLGCSGQHYCGVNAMLCNNFRLLAQQITGPAEAPDHAATNH
jgi:hypothetical protein